MKLDRQYRQEQAESKLFGHASSGSKFGKLSGKSMEKSFTPATAPVERAPPLAMAVTPECISDAMDVDQAGRCPPIRCFNCGKIGHTARNCCEKRKITEVHTEEEEPRENFPEESQ
jgi:Zinc knuckle